MERWRRWRRIVEVEITPVEGADREIAVTTTEKIGRHFPDLGCLSDEKGRATGKNRLRMAANVILVIYAVREFSRAASTFVPVDLISDPVLNQLSFLNELSNQLGTYPENPLAVGIIAATAAWYLGKNAYRERGRLRAVATGLHRTSISPTIVRVSPIDPPDDPLPNNPNPPIP